MWTRSAANKITGKVTVTCTDFHGDVFFTGEFDNVQDADCAGESAERRMTTWENSGRYQPDGFDDISDDDLLQELLT